MTIQMYCDHCGEKVPTDVNGGVRVRTGNRELAFHLCPEHQAALRDFITSFCGVDPPREVATTLRNV